MKILIKTIRCNPCCRRHLPQRWSSIWQYKVAVVIPDIIIITLDPYSAYFAAPSLAGLWDQYKLNIIHLYPIFHTHWIIFNLFCSPTPCRVMRFMCIIFNHIPWSVFNIHYSLNQSYSIFIVLYSTYFATPPLAGWWQSLVVEEYGTGICRLPTPAFA